MDSFDFFYFKVRLRQPRVYAMFALGFFLILCPLFAPDPVSPQAYGGMLLVACGLAVARVLWMVHVRVKAVVLTVLMLAFGIWLAGWGALGEYAAVPADEVAVVGVAHALFLLAGMFCLKVAIRRLTEYGYHHHHAPAYQ